MDRNSVLRYFEEKKIHYSAFSGEDLLQALNLQEFIHIEDKKRDLFLKRIDFICMAKSLKIAMARESGYKQLKRYTLDQ